MISAASFGCASFGTPLPAEFSLPIPFTKVQGNGNDFIAFYFPDDLPSSETTSYLQKAAPRLCHRSYGVGADGLILYTGSSQKGAVRFINSDGSIPAMCGNGLLSTFYLLSRLYTQMAPTCAAPYWIQTDAGIHGAALIDQKSTVFLPAPKTALREISIDDLFQEISVVTRAAFLVVGVPHLLLLVETLSDLENLNLAQIAPPLRYHPLFAPAGTNVNFLYYDPSKKVGYIRTYERGVEGETLACGTGSCASACFLSAVYQSDRIELITRSGARVRVVMASVTGSNYLHFSGDVTATFAGILSPAYWS